MAPVVAGTAAIAWRLRPSLIHLQLASFQVVPVELGDCSRRVFTCSEFHKTESSRAAAFPVANDACRGHLKPLPAKYPLQAFIGHFKRVIADIEVRHFRSPLDVSPDCYN